MSDVADIESRRGTAAYLRQLLLKSECDWLQAMRATRR